MVCGRLGSELWTANTSLLTRNVKPQYRIPTLYSSVECHHVCRLCGIMRTVWTLGGGADVGAALHPVAVPQTVLELVALLICAERKKSGRKWDSDVAIVPSIRVQRHGYFQPNCFDLASFHNYSRENVYLLNMK